ncbi:MAG: transglycosylase domain-containing protein [Solirubrobacteraceae bacterium]
MSGLGVLATISALFGMMMAVASDLPEIDVLDVSTRPSYILDRDGNEMGILTGNENRLLVKSAEIAPTMKHAIVAIEDRRFYTNSGVDLRAIARATYQDVIARSAAQGGSTIAQQLVKNRLEAQNDRTIFQKMREAAMAFHMTREWDKERILRNYLNTIYFGNGAYGIEAAARTYFGDQFGLGGAAPQCGSGATQKRCASLLEPAQAALLAGVVANPAGYDPVTNPVGAEERRDLVLLRMREQDYLTELQYQDSLAETPPLRGEVHPPDETADFPYFTTWVRQQVVDQVGAGRAFEGGLQVKTTIDGELQVAAQQAITDWLGETPGFGGVPAASMVVLDNDTSEVLALVGGNDESFNRRPFNLATQGQRQPGSSFKPFILAEALEQGVSPYKTYASQQKDLCVAYNKAGECIEYFEVNNYEDSYSGVTDLAGATANSDNSVYAELGLDLGTKRIARMANRLGIRTEISTNPAMTLGGLEQGVTVLDMAHAYESFATGGELVYGSLSPGATAYEDSDGEGAVPGPVGIQSILEPDGDDLKPVKLRSGGKADNKTERERVLDEEVAAQMQTLLGGVVSGGTGTRAAVSGAVVAGKTGTTENYGDAWFVGWTEEYTVAVWVGYPNSIKPMDETNFTFNGEPVAGGTYPASIFSSFINAALTIRPPEGEEDGADTDVDAVDGVPTVTDDATEATTPPTTEPEAPVREEEAPEVEEEAPVAPPVEEAPVQEEVAPVVPAEPEVPAEPPPATDDGGAVAAPPG